jgi:hypothetical protein
MNALKWILAIIVGLLGLFIGGSTSAVFLLSRFNPDGLMSFMEQYGQPEQVGQLSEMFGAIAGMSGVDYLATTLAFLFVALGAFFLLFRSGLSQVLALLALLAALGGASFNALGDGFSAADALAIGEPALPFLIFWIVALFAAGRSE